ncbi:GNAT family N-acetyltransferase [Brevibacillus agri]|uniref:GNAT family N-acetyltransferase n=1 Tax=Brevibacillus agri TaxID=51101 RepID=UPI0024BF2E2E|nr:GNAT family N-acetyltransferase [Brevibacillus agri]WHX32166.1 GNAT family N-acetyltransferase [Brevibacillus agri]
MKIVAASELPKSVIADFFTVNWGSPQMVISSGVFRCDELDGYAVLGEDGAIQGYVSYVLEAKECEIISLDSLAENKGIGSKLLAKAEQTAREHGCLRMKLVTTNDNLHAMGFYQRRGFQLSALYANAVEKARAIKPEIPLVADNGIPIRDEILLVKPL